MTEKPFPWSREVWALLLDRLFGAGARAVMFDMIFSPPNDGDPAFHAALDRYRDKVVIGANFDVANAAQAVTPNNTLIPPPQLQDNRVGFVNFWADPIDGKIRAVTYRVTDRQLAELPPDPSQEIYQSLSARALAKIGHASDVPDDFRGHLIRFTSPDAFAPRPLYEVFDPKFWHANYADGAFFKDKIVMVGSSAQVEHDTVVTPMSPTTLGPALHLQAMAAAMNHEFLRPTPARTGLALVGMAGLTAWLLVAFLRRPLLCRWYAGSDYGGLSWRSTIVLRRNGAAASHSSSSLSPGVQRIFFAWFRIRARAARETAHSAHVGALRLEKFGQGDPGKSGQLLQLASRSPRPCDNFVLGFDWFHHVVGKSRSRGIGLATQ